jgi:plastocyanin
VRTRRLLPIALSLLVLGATSCGADDDDASGDAPATVTEATVATTDTAMSDTATPDTASPEAAEMEAAVEIADFAFGPAEVTIAAGGTVTWTNTDNQPHTATSSGNFDTGSIAAGSAVTVTFDEPGTFTYICSFHPFMTATVTVV